MSIKSKIQALITAANTKTGETDATLTDAVQTLVDGYGGGGADPVINPLSVTENGTYTAPSGVDGYSPVTVNVSGGGGYPTYTIEFDIDEDYTATNATETFVTAVDTDFRDFLVASAPDNIIVSAWQNDAGIKVGGFAWQTIVGRVTGGTGTYVYQSISAAGSRYTDEDGSLANYSQYGPNFTIQIANVNRSTGAYNVAGRCNAGSVTIIPAGHYKVTFYAIPKEVA